MSEASSTTTESVADLTQHQIKVLLVDDQAIIGEAVRRMLSADPDIVLEYCGDPTKAVETAEAFGPTLILQDLVMPDIDGLTLVRTFRGTPATENVPMIVLSTKEEPKVKAEAFGLGANDYLVKLPDKVELIARIRYHSNSYINLLQRNEAFDKLTESQEALAAELAEAADYVRGILPKPLAAEESGPVVTDWKFIPSTSLGGDAFGYHWLDDDNFCLYLLDVCGHGVGAALLSVSAMNTITNRTLPDVDFTDPGKVIEALNAAYPMERQNNMYFTMWYGIWHRPSGKLTYASAGHPPAVLVGDGGERVEELRTPAMPVGTLNGLTFNSAETEIKPGDFVYVFSDGTYEVKRPDGSMMELEEFVALLGNLSQSGSPHLDGLIAEVRRQQHSDKFVDDFSIVEFRFGE
ncbi:MAG: SpoIIE family protein phosphatase [Verrucomicrobiota bacterium]